MATYFSYTVNFGFQIDGDSVSGICFVGNLHGAYRGGFVLAPVGIAIVCGLFFLIRGMQAMSLSFATVLRAALKMGWLFM